MRCGTRNKRDRRRSSSVSPPSNRYQRNKPVAQKVRSDETSERQRYHQQQRRKRRVSLVAFGIIAVAVTVIALSRNYMGSFAVVPSSSSINMAAFSADVYQESLASYFKEHPLQRFRLALNRDELRQYLQQDHSEVQLVKDTQRSKDGVSEIHIVFRNPVARWTINKQTYFVDTHGIIFRRNYFATPKINVVDKSHSYSTGGGAVASQRTLSFIGKVSALATRKGIPVSNAEIPAASLRMVYLNSKKAPQIRIAVDRGVEYQIDAAHEAYRYFSSKNRRMPKYIDVRVEGKVFYK